jgi:group II intron reverse transcriptase/maturase
MQTSLQGIANKARRDKKYRFRDLYRLLNEENLVDSWRFINLKAASGVDRTTAREYGKNLRGNIKDLVKRLKEKRYRTKLVRRVYIPKSGGKLRPLGIPATEEKLVQLVVARILNAIYEQDFLPNSFGYRPKVGAKEAVQDITSVLFWEKFGYIVDADIKGFFDSIDHDWLISMLEQRIDDRAFIGLIRKWLKAGVLTPGGGVEYPAKGTPQGGIVSPILANIYLHYVLDLWFEKVVKPRFGGEAYLCRYADGYQRDAERFYDALVKRLKKFGLEVAEDKTKVIRFTRSKNERGKSFEFLGFEFCWGVGCKGKETVKRRTSRERYKKSLKNFKEWCRESRNYRLNKLFSLLNAKLRGYYNYYGVIGNYNSLNEFYTQARRILYKWLNRRSQRRSFNYEEFSEVLKRYRIEKPRITEKLPRQLSFSWS